MELDNNLLRSQKGQFSHRLQPKVRLQSSALLLVAIKKNIGLKTRPTGFAFPIWNPRPSFIISIKEKEQSS